MDVQLRYVARAQFPTQPLLQLDHVEELLSLDALDKPLSALYRTLPITDSPKIERLWDLWKEDIPSLDREDCEDCLEQCPKLVSSRDKLIQSSRVPAITCSGSDLGSKPFAWRSLTCSILGFG